jgi:hypothetical protein
MRDRKKQRLLRKTKEKGLSPRDSAGLPDPTPFEAVKRIIEREKKEAAGISAGEREAGEEKPVQSFGEKIGQKE